MSNLCSSSASEVLGLQVYMEPSQIGFSFLPEPKTTMLLTLDGDRPNKLTAPGACGHTFF